MATCPFLSYTPIASVSGNFSTQVSEGSSGFEFQDFATSSITYGSLTQVSCLGASCQIWDATNSRCGMLVTDTIMDSPTNETDTLITLLEGVMGKISELDSSNSLTTYFQNVIGTSAEAAVVIPSHPDGCTECGNPANLVNSGKHINTDHYDEMGASPPYAAILITEYMANEERDGNAKIYGYDFKIRADDDDKPKMLKGIETSPDWTEPPEIVDWADLLAWHQGGSAPTFSANPDY